jgi:hypothetical protein
LKINLGASRNWVKEGWVVLDHKLENSTSLRIKGDISKIDLQDRTCDLVFVSHVLEHVPHIKIQAVFAEINRIMKIGSGIRILVPDLRKIASAYVNNDLNFFLSAKKEDENIRQDLSIGGMFVNFIVSPGQDTVLFDRNINNFIAGYAHLYAYDFDMIKILLEHFGFNNIKQVGFCESNYDDFKEPLHVVGLEPVWVNLNKNFYQENNLIHHYQSESGGYEINFDVTGFDRDPITSLIVEAKKTADFQLNADNNINGTKVSNYNYYAYSLMKVKNIKNKINILTKISKRIENAIFLEKILKMLQDEN